jgi:hypothetical protein
LRHERRQGQRGGQVHHEHFTEAVLEASAIENGRPGSVHGSVDQNVDTPKSIDDRVDGLLDVVTVRDVSTHGENGMLIGGQLMVRRDGIDQALILRCGDRAPPIPERSNVVSVGVALAES